MKAVAIVAALFALSFAAMLWLLLRAPVQPPDYDDDDGRDED